VAKGKDEMGTGDEIEVDITVPSDRYVFRFLVVRMADRQYIQPERLSYSL